MKDDSKLRCEREKARGSRLRDEDPLLFFTPAFIGLSGQILITVLKHVMGDRGLTELGDLFMGKIGDAHLRVLRVLLNIA